MTTTVRVRAVPSAPVIRARVTPAMQPLQAALRNTGSQIQWRIGQDGVWQDLIEIDDLDASVEVGTVTTLVAGSPATVTNVGTAQDAILDFGIPAGADGVMPSVVAGTGIDVDDTDPANPEVSLDSATITSLGKADTAVQPGDLGTAAAADTGTSSGNVPVLNGSGKLDYSVVPAVDFATKSTAEAYDPIVAPDFIRTAGYTSAGDGGGALYKKVVSEPSHAGKFSITLDDGVTVVWYELAVAVVRPQMTGAVGDGTTDDTTALVAADAAAVALGVDLHLFAGSTYRISSNVEFASSVVGMNTALVATAPTTDAEPTVSVYADHLWLENSHIGYLKVYVGPSTGNASTDLKAHVKNCRFTDGAKITIGHATAISFGHLIEGNEFTSGQYLSRYGRAIELINVCQSHVRHNRVQEYSRGVGVYPTRSFASFGLNISDNIFSNCQVGIELLGYSMYRIVKPKIAGNTIAGTSRDAASSNLAGIRGSFLIDPLIEGNSITDGLSQGIHLQAVLGGEIRTNVLSSGFGSTQPPIRLSGCQDLLITKNRCHVHADGYTIIAVTPASNTIVSGNPYVNKNLNVIDNDFFCQTRGVAIQGGSGNRVVGNRFRSASAPGGNGFVNFSGTSIDNYHYDNEFYAPSGTPVVVAGGSAASSTRPATTVIATTTSAVSVTAPVETDPDTDLNNAVSYVTEFTVGSIYQMHQMADDSAMQTLTEWMGDATSPTLGWNSSAWTSVGNRVSDIVNDGTPFDNYAIEYHPSARYCMALIDRHGWLTCRDFYFSSYPDDHLIHLAAHSIAERAWITATFRPPLVVDGAVYDSVSSGMISQSTWDTQISGRQALGQKSDGTFVLVTVDGATDVSGCTLEQLADKMLALGCLNAFNLDGGGSTTLWYDGAIVNVPSDAGGERDIPAVMYV